MRFFLEKRVNTSPWGRVTVLAAAMLLVLFISLFFFLGEVLNLLQHIRSLERKFFLTTYGLGGPAVKMTPLMFTGLAVALAAQMRLWNIGAGKGQFHMGGFCSDMVCFTVRWQTPRRNADCFNVPDGYDRWWILGKHTRLPESKFGVNDIITSLLLNYVAVAWLDHLLFGDWRDPKTNNFPITKEFSEAAQLRHLENSSTCRTYYCLCFCIV
ncbi:MAG: hypothetical protein CM1200mP30_03380 [Pseudomonadota bacterium]|nr:MAG: hypothetical protein CM1200mP30_03380 [Pseudomonadota bacterium]